MKKQLNYVGLLLMVEEESLWKKLIKRVKIKKIFFCFFFKFKYLIDDNLKSFQLIPLLYKLSLFRESISGNEPTLIISQDNSYSLPPKLLQAWNSRQRFDVQVEAISPWLHAWANHTGLNAATKPPKAPEGVRIYATQQV
jgi:hypothetical protein